MGRKCLLYSSNLGRNVVGFDFVFCKTFVIFFVTGISSVFLQRGLLCGLLQMETCLYGAA